MRSKSVRVYSALVLAAVAGLVLTARPAHAQQNLFGGCDFYCQQRRDQKAQDKAARAQAKAQEKAAKQLRKENERRARLGYPPLQADTATYAQQPAPQVQTNSYQQPQYNQPVYSNPAPQAQPTYSQPTYAQPSYAQPAYDQTLNSDQPNMVIGPDGQMVDVSQKDANGVPLYTPDGKKMSDKDKALWPFRHQPAQNMPVYVAVDTWTAQYEQKFAQFVAQFGAGVKAKPKHLLNFYMHDPSINPYAANDPQGVIYYSDCADLPYFLRSYFAYQEHLPFSIATDPVMNMQPYASLPADGFTTWSMANPGRTDASPYGNTLTRRAASNLVTAYGREKNFINWWSNLMDAGSTRSFMVSPWTPNYNLSDVYPVKIDRTGIGPGTLVHSDGHMLVVIAVRDNGDIELIDAHPDNSLQFKILDPSNLMRDRPDRAYGFFRFRPMQAQGGSFQNVNVNGQTFRLYYGGKVVAMTDQQLFAGGYWSVEQWMGPGSTMAPATPADPRQYKTAFADVPFFFYVRSMLSPQVEQADKAASDLLDSVCDAIGQRVPDVDLAFAYTRQAHPDSIPLNIYNTDPPWETLATPSRDARLRQAVMNLPDLIAKYYRYGSQNKYKLTYSGSAQSYQQAVLAKWASLDRACLTSYKNSNRQVVTINFSQAVSRAPRMSFDYSECPEKRWGASDQEIAATCKDGDPSGRWYKAEQSMRNTGAKSNDAGVVVVRSDRPVTLDMLESGRYLNQPDAAAINLGYSRSVVPDVKAYFASPQFLNDLGR